MNLNLLRMTFNKRQEALIKEWGWKFSDHRKESNIYTKVSDKLEIFYNLKSEITSYKINSFPILDVAKDRALKALVELNGFKDKYEHFEDFYDLKVFAK